MTNYKIACLCCTHGRFKCLQRSVKCYLDQTYEGESVLFIANSGEPLFWNNGGYIIFDVSDPDTRESEVHCFKLPDNKNIVIWNMPKNSYNSVGEKYEKALNYLLNKCTYKICKEAKIITSWDDDDIFLPDHLKEGNAGMNKAYNQNMLAYKPRFSYFRSREGIIRNENTYEPSIFVDAKYIEKTGYAPVSVKYHQQWLDPLIEQNKILVDSKAPSTLIYNWGDGWDTYKLSGRGSDDNGNFQDHKKLSNDMGQGVLIPNEDNSSYYDEINLIK